MQARIWGGLMGTGIVREPLHTGTAVVSSAKPAIFVGGVARSGTKLMMRLLNQHPDIAAFGETKLSDWRIFKKFPRWFHLCPPQYRERQIEVFKRLCLTRFYWHRVGWQLPRAVLAVWKGFDGFWLSRFYRFQSGWNRNSLLVSLEQWWLTQAVQARTFALRIPQGLEAQKRLGMRGLYRWFSRSDIERCFEQLDCLTEAATYHEVCRRYGAFWDALFSMHAKRRGKAYWAEKTPNNVLCARFLDRCFDWLRIINMVRDGRDVACSAVRTGWSRDDPLRAVDRWGRTLQMSLRQLEMVAPERCLNVRYEDLVLETEPTLRRITDFLEVDFDNAMLSFPVYATSIGAYARQLSPNVRHQVLERWSELLAQWGYGSRH
jgi:hypothetical protein